ncbi:MAG TPA: hydrogenase expression/formation protein HypE, partial [Acidilobales archaeon]|nr:hydrogenase expression/formation protein HypE [Acidilobales archaeon]
MREGSIKIYHGAGAREMWELIDSLIISKVPKRLMKVLGGIGIDVLDDGSAIKLGDEYLVLSVDSYTVNPIFFPGGNIGHLAVNGTINDLVVMGAKPIAFMDTIVVEEGFPLSDLETIVNSMIEVLKSEGIALIGGDFKVMPKGNIDRIVITGVGIGITDTLIIDSNIREGDKLIVISPIAEHGAVILAAQLGLLDQVKGLKSDSR